MSEISHPHDKFFKETFSRVEVARDFLSNYLPPSAIEGLDLNTMELQLVVYHGQRQWRIATNFGDLFDGPEGLRLYWPTFQYELRDLKLYSDEDIRGIAMSRIAVLTLKYIFDHGLDDRLSYILSLFSQLKNEEMALEYLETWLRYLATTTRIPQERMKRTIEVAFGEGEMMNRFTEAWTKEALEQGLEQGQRQALRESILELLSIRFDAAPTTVLARLEAIEEIDVLRALHRQAATAETLASFEQSLLTCLPPRD